MEVATVTSTPSTTTVTSSPAAPAIGAPSPSVTPGQRPTFDQVFAADAAPAPETPQPEGTPAIPATEPAAAESAIHPSTQTPGPIPFAAHKTALENARTKATVEAQATFDREYGWAKQIPRETLDHWSGIAQKMSSNPAEFLETYFAEAANHPQFGQAVKSWAARTLASRQAKVPDLTPDVQIVDQDGRVTGATFSAERVQALLEHAVDQRMAPLQQESAQRKADQQRQATEAKQAETAKRLEASADAVLADLSEILEVTDATPAEDKHALYAELNALLDADPELTPHKAAMQLRKTRIVPALEGKAAKKVLEDLNTKAGAQGMNPASAGVAPTHRPRSFSDPSLKW